MVSIKNVLIDKTAALAPMADVADHAFRRVAKKFGAAYVTGEMVSAKGLVYGGEKTAELLKVTDCERPMAVQLFGSQPDFMAEAARIASGYKPDIIDINAGCPVAKVVDTGAGCALMKTPKLFGEIVAAVVKAVDIPVTVKIRSGWDSASVNAVLIAQIAEEAGASAITVHGRTKAQMYSGKADLGIIAEVKAAVDIPVIGNGDIVNAVSCAAMYERTGCDLVAVGRAACGRPWVFAEIDSYIRTGVHIPELPFTEKLAVMREHIELIVRSKGENVGMREARKHAAWYLKGLRGAAGYRERCFRLTGLDEFYALLELIKSGEM